MEYLKKCIIIEYLVNEIDLCVPKEDVYKSYGDDLYKIADLDIELQYNSYRERFIMKITSMNKRDILHFCKKELFIIDIYKVQEVLKRKLEDNDYDYYNDLSDYNYSDYDYDLSDSEQSIEHIDYM